MLHFIIAVIVGLLTGIISGMGFGGGTILIIYLAVFLDLPQITSQGINLIYFIPTAAIAIISHIKAGRIDKKSVLFLTSFSVIGAIAGSVLAGILTSVMLKKAFAVSLFFLGLYELYKVYKGYSNEKSK